MQSAKTKDLCNACIRKRQNRREKRKQRRETNTFLTLSLSCPPLPSSFKISSALTPKEGLTLMVNNHTLLWCLTTAHAPFEMSDMYIFRYCLHGGRSLHVRGCTCPQREDCPSRAVGRSQHNVNCLRQEDHGSRDKPDKNGSGSFVWRNPELIIVIINASEKSRRAQVAFFFSFSIWTSHGPKFLRVNPT